MTESARIPRALVAVSLGLSCILAALILLRRPSTIALGILLALLLGGLLAWRAAGRSRAAGGVLLLASLNAVIVWPELTLRLAGFRYEAGVEFGFPRRIDFTRFAPDPDLFWTYPRGTPGVNAMGFRDGEVSVPKPPGVFRVLYLGDSCTDLGEPNYPTLVERLLNADAGGETRAESVVLAVSGYSSHQGRVAAEKYGRTLTPDAAVVYFGWNDHWRAMGEPDAAKRPGRPAGRVAKIAEWTVGRSRMLHVIRRLGDRLGRRGDDTPPDVVRVPLPDYRTNLTAIADHLREAGAHVVLVTAPTAWNRMGVSQRHIDGGFVPDAATALARHRAYNEVVREVASATGALLLDLEPEFDSLPELTDLMLEDGIHFSTSGLAFLAKRVAGVLGAPGRAPSGSDQ